MKSSLKQVARHLIDTVPFGALVGELERLDRRQANVVRVLTYHRVADPGANPWAYPRIMVTPEAFGEQMGFLATNYDVISAGDLVAFYEDGRALPPRAAMVTFDDAYEDFATTAWPLLRRMGLPATLFVPTAFPDRPDRVFWWDRLYHALWSAEGCDAVDTPVGRLALGTRPDRERAFTALRGYVKTVPHEQGEAWVEQLCHHLGSSLPDSAVLGWQALRRLASDGVALGAHTRNHPLMTRVAADVMCHEAVASRQDLEREVGDVLPIFAYPSGAFDKHAMRMLGQAGFVVAFTTGHGINDLARANPLCLRRINVGVNTTLAEMRMRMLSWSP